MQKSKSNTKDKQVHVTTKKLSEETEQNPTEPNPTEVITLLDRHRSAILFEVYLWGAIAIFKLPRETSNGHLWVGI